MKDNLDNSFDQDEVNSLVTKFETMLAEGACYFFDVEEFEILIDHYFYSRNIEQAFGLIDMAKDQHPFAFDLSLKEAELLAYSDRTDEALKSLEKLELVEANNPDLFITKANIYSQKGNYAKAIESLEKAAKNSDEAVDEIYLSLSFEYQNMNNMPKALEYVRQAIKINPSNIDALYELAYCYELEGDKSELCNFLDEYLDKTPYSFDAWFLLGNTFSNLEDFEKAIDAYDYALAIKDDFISAIFNKANALVRLERYDEARSCFEETLNSDISPSLIYYYIGDCYHNSDDFESALKFYKKSVQDDENFGDAWLAIGQALESLDRISEGIHYVKKAINIDQNHGTYWGVLGEFQQKLGFLSDAIISFEKSIELDPEDYTNYLGLADTLYECNEILNAITTITSGIEKNTDCAELYYRLCAYLFIDGQKAEALHVLQIALELEANAYHLLFEYLPITQNIEEVILLIEQAKK